MKRKKIKINLLDGQEVHRNVYGSDDKNESQRSIRLNKYVSNSGICTRREADELIAKGLIAVNKRVETCLGTKVGVDDIVEYDGKVINPEKKQYVLLNKPKGFVTSVDKDERHKKKVNILIQNACKEKVEPLARMDENSTGLLLFSNDLGLQQKFTKSSSKFKQIYHIFLNKPFDKADLDAVIRGVHIDNLVYKLDAISYTDVDKKDELGVEIHIGDNMDVISIFKHLGYDVVKIDCVYLAGLTKKNLTRGRWRFLNQKEINGLKMI